ncbi:uncharacterized protein LOC103713159 [Phoenix dactylifera]|uniref:Uncharacterized protein LOC103713159 n=1 Tax=Phoenix dactylifera TaxID=42345 RepID=A0A8B9A4B5_PHODC|nr:uncharacterized protein LOC103713159 [Phoenix dactylifera]
MDPKTLAKSKRKHTQQGRKNHPPPAAASAQKKKPAPAAAAAAAAGAGEVAKPRRAHARARDLPSNWDRYDDGDDSGDGAESSAGTKLVDGEIRPKSKGADFQYLVDQARSQQDYRDLGTSESAFSLDDLPSDFIQGISSMLSVRGESLLSWCADDNFIVDDDPTSSCEANFLSMDLHALAAQLSKLKLSQRLFIEEDLLPEELHINELKANQIYEQSEASTMSEHKYSLSLGGFDGNTGLEKSADGQIDHWNSCNVHGITREAVVEKCQTQSSTEQATKFDPINDSTPVELSGRREVQGSILQLSKHTVPDLKQNRTSRFEAAAAAEELDMLLNSLSETSLSSSHSDGITKDASTSHDATFNSSVHMSPLSVGQDPNSSGNAGTSLADAIDDLLAETSLSLKDQKYTVCPPNEGALSPTNLSFQSLLGSEPPGNSNSSSQVARDATLDDAIDDLLAETSFSLKEQKHMACPEKQGTTSSMHAPSHSPSGSKPVDDFDSWFDKL